VSGNSRQISSNQHHVHPRLVERVVRHLKKAHRKPLATHSRQAFDKLRERLAATARPLVLDSFCGTGKSTAMLAEKHPEHLVVGIDKSAQRLARHSGNGAANYLLLQADCHALWQQLSEEGIGCDYHYLLYPNPWPKAAHLQRRIHGHPALPHLLGLGGTIELRSNWQIYVEEFGLALHLAGYRGHVSKLPGGEPDLTLFETKYRGSGHDIWTFKTTLGNRDEPGIMS
jgi:tRNA G46 methylase TrmB